MDPSQRHRILSRLHADLGGFTPRMRQVASYIIDNPVDFGLDPLRQTASRCGVSTYTLVRMAKYLGFDSFDALREPFRRALSARDDGAGAPQWLLALHRRDAFGAAQADASKNSLSNVRHALQTLSTDETVALIDLLVGARRVYITAVRATYALAYYFHYVGRMALPHLQLIPSGMNSAVDELTDAGGDDVLIAMCFNPYSRETVEACRFARERGVQLVLLADSSVALAELEPAHTLTAAVQSTHHFACFAGPMAMLDTLLALLMARGGAPAAARVRDYEAVRAASNAYWRNKKNTLFF
ncbi:MAG: MurR/RpiR family transcriptional regulator [Pseudomonadota bacterium]